VLESGEYDIELYYVSDECGADFAFEIDGKQIGIFSSHSDTQTRNVFNTSFFLEAGNHFFKLVPLRGKSCLMIDNMVMELN